MSNDPCHFCLVNCGNSYCFTNQPTKGNYVKVEVIKISKLDRMRCEDFANEQIDTSINHYKKRKQGNRDKIIQDIVTGKLGELAAHRLLKRHGIHAKEPDFNIYIGRKKSFDADITWKGNNFHCKSQTEESANKYGTSWILQYGGAGFGHQDKLFRHCDDNDFLIATVVSETFVTIFYCTPVRLLFDRDLVKLPQLKWFHDTKRAIYWDDIKELDWTDRWGSLSKLKNKG